MDYFNHDLGCYINPDLDFGQLTLKKAGWPENALTVVAYPLVTEISEFKGGVTGLTYLGSEGSADTYYPGMALIYEKAEIISQRLTEYDETGENISFVGRLMTGVSIGSGDTAVYPLFIDALINDNYLAVIKQIMESTAPLKEKTQNISDFLAQATYAQSMEKLKRNALKAGKNNH
jgi:hypothetical protein